MPTPRIWPKSRMSQLNQTGPPEDNSKARVFSLDDVDDLTEIKLTKLAKEGDIAIFVHDSGTSFWVFRSGEWVAGGQAVNPVLFGMVDTTDFSGSQLTNATARNAEALTLALASANGRPVHIPSGRYRIGAVNITGSIFGDGDSSILEPTSTLVITASNVSLKNLKFFSFTATATSTTNVQLANVRFESLTYDWDSSVASNFLAIDSSYTEGLVIAFNRFFKGGVQATRAYNSECVDNYFDMQWKNNINEPIHFSQFSRGIISRNTILNSCTDAIDLFSNGDRCVVADNRIDGVGDITLAVGVNRGEAGIVLKIEKQDGVGGSSGEGGLGYTEGTRVSGNQIRNINPTSNNNRWYGILIRYQDSRATPVNPMPLSEASRNLIVTENIIEGFWTTNPHGYTVVYFACIHFDGFGANISDNIFANISCQGSAAIATQTCGVELGFGSPAISIKATGCIVSRNIYEGEGSGLIIYEAEHSVISENIVQKDHVNNLSPRYGLNIYGGVTYCGIEDNVFNPVFANPAAIQTSGSGVLTSCKVSGNISLSGVPCYIGRAVKTVFSENQFGYVSFGTDNTEQAGNRFLHNDFHGINSLPGLEMFSQSSFQIVGNNFWGCEIAIRLDGSDNDERTYNGIIKENFSHTELSGSFVEFVDMTAPKQATIVRYDNFVNGALANSSGTVKIGGQVTSGGEIISGAGSYAATSNPLGVIDQFMILPDVDGVVTLFNWANTNFTRLQFGGRSASFPALARVGATLSVVLADNTGLARLTAASLNLPEVPVHADNAAALAGGLVAGDLYRTGGDPDQVSVVH